MFSMEDQSLIKKIALIPFLSKRVIACIKDEDTREKYFRRLFTSISDEDRGSIVASFSTREKQLELLPLLKNDAARMSFIKNSMSGQTIWYSLFT